MKPYHRGIKSTTRAVFLSLILFLSFLNVAELIVNIFRSGGLQSACLVG